MAHTYQTDQYEGMIAETVSMRGHNGDTIGAYVARPLGSGPFPGMVVIHHAPGWDEWYRECTRRFAHHGYVAISPNLYHRDGHGTPEDVGAKVRAAGGAPDARVLGARLKPGETLEYALQPGRHAYLVPASGALTVNGVRIDKGDGAAIRDERLLRLAALDDTEVVLVDSA